MSLEHNGAEPSQQQEAEPPSHTDEMQLESCSLSDADLQEKYRKEYLEQLKRRSCPGCGENLPFLD